MQKLRASNGYGSVESSSPTDKKDESVNCSQVAYYLPLKDFSDKKPLLSNAMAASSLIERIRTSSDWILHHIVGYSKSNPSCSSVGLTMTSHPSTNAAIQSHHNDEESTVLYLEKRNSSQADMRLSMISNFSAAYNTINISLALILMRGCRHPPSESEVGLCSSVLIGGMIVGQIFGGVLGDWLGRHVAMSIVMSLQVVSAFWSGWVGIIRLGASSLGIYQMLAICRFLLGVGCGGVYPLAATITAESSSCGENRGKLVALTFSMQGVGYLAASLTAYSLVWMLGDESDVAWRLLLGFGCLPGVGLIVIRLLHRKLIHDVCTDCETQQRVVVSTEKEQSATCQQYESKTVQVRLNAKSLYRQILNEPNVLSKMIGTAGCWLMFDILFYGNALFQPIVFAAAFGKSETILATVRDSTVISLIALPGYFVSVYMIGSQSPKRIQLQGFLMMALLYAIIGLNFSSLAANRQVLMSLYGLTFFFSNYGPNTTTFMMPSITFSRICRASLSGVCAASGKVGALFGSIIFLPLASWFGKDKVMIACSCVSLTAAAMTLFLEDSVDQEATMKSTSSEAQLLSLDALEDERPNIRKTGSMPSIFDQF